MAEWGTSRCELRGAAASPGNYAGTGGLLAPLHGAGRSDRGKWWALDQADLWGDGAALHLVRRGA